jgi:hypothetical protein
MSPTPPSLSWPLYCFENTLNQHFMSSKPLVFKLLYNPSFLREIWDILWSDPLNFQAKHFTDDLRVFITIGDLSPRRTRCYPGVTKVVMDLRKFILPSPSWRFHSEKQNEILVIIQRGLRSRETQLFVVTSTEMKAIFVVSWTSEINLVSLVHACFDFIIVLA